jgi:hypothetical protein
MRWSSVSAKVFIAFLVVMAAFGGVTTYGALAMRRLDDELRRIARGYLTVRLDLHDLQTYQFNLLQHMERTDEEFQRSPRFVKTAVDSARAYRKKNLKKVEDTVARLRAEATEPDEAAFLEGVAARLRGIGAVFEENEELFDKVYGPALGKPRAVTPDEAAAAREKLLRREERVWKKDLGDLTRDLRLRVQEAEAQLDRHERRALWATVLLAILAVLIGLGVMVRVGRALAPLG